MLTAPPAPPSPRLHGSQVRVATLSLAHGDPLLPPQLSETEPATVCSVVSNSRASSGIAPLFASMKCCTLPGPCTATAAGKPATRTQPPPHPQNTVVPVATPHVAPRTWAARLQPPLLLPVQATQAVWTVGAWLPAMPHHAFAPRAAVRNGLRLARECDGEAAQGAGAADLGNAGVARGIPNTAASAERGARADHSFLVHPETGVTQLHVCMQVLVSFRVVVQQPVVWWHSAHVLTVPEHHLQVCRSSVVTPDSATQCACHRVHSSHFASAAHA